MSPAPSAAPGIRLARLNSRPPGRLFFALILLFRLVAKSLLQQVDIFQRVLHADGRAIQHYGRQVDVGEKVSDFN